LPAAHIEKRSEKKITVRQGTQAWKITLSNQPLTIRHCPLSVRKRKELFLTNNG
jgi:hypothetical protein